MKREELWELLGEAPAEMIEESAVPLPKGTPSILRRVLPLAAAAPLLCATAGAAAAPSPRCTRRCAAWLDWNAVSLREPGRESPGPGTWFGTMESPIMWIFLPAARRAPIGNGRMRKCRGMYGIILPIRNRSVRCRKLRRIRLTRLQRKKQKERRRCL